MLLSDTLKLMILLNMRNEDPFDEWNKGEFTFKYCCIITPNCDKTKMGSLA